MKLHFCSPSLGGCGKFAKVTGNKATEKWVAERPDFKECPDVAIRTLCPKCHKRNEPHNLDFLRAKQ